MAKFTGHTITSDSALGSAVIKRSLRFNQDDSAYITRTVGTTGNRRTWTVSFWVKFCDLSGANSQRFWSNESGDGNGDIFKIEYYNGNSSERRLGFIDNNHAGSGIRFTTNRRFRDNAWYHIVMAVDTTQATDTNRVKIYVNGEQEIDNWASGSEHNHPPNQNYDTCVNLSGEVNSWGRSFSFGSSSAVYFDGYLAEINFIDGQQLSPTDVGFTDPVTGIWMPKRYEGTYGTNGYRLDFSDNTSTTTLGIDKSPNGNDFTLNNFAVSDSVLDTPTNNFATWNVVDGEGKDNKSNFSEGNLKVQIAYQGNDEESGATLAFSSGKWYWEEYMQASTADASMVGVGVKSIEGIYSHGGNHWRVRGGGGESDHNGSQTNVSGFSWTTGDIIGIAVDMDAGTWTASKNGTFIGANIHTNISGTVVPTMHNSNGSERHTFITNFGQDSSFAGTKTAQGYKDANGIGDFYYPVPSGYQALCSANLPPNVSSITRPKRHFDTLLYTGTGSSNIVEGLEFSPDMIWVKGRDTNGYEHMIIDSVRGGTNSLVPSSTDTESTHGGRSMTFYPGGVRWNSDSGNCNANGEKYALWCWKGGGSSSTFNIDGKGYTTAAAAGLDGGSLDPTGASINTKAGFSILTYTGTTSVSETIAHGLGKKPAWILIKSRNVDGQDWVMYHQKLDGGNQPATHILKLNNSNTEADVNDVWQDTEPTSSVFTIGTEAMVNHQAGHLYVAYCWSEIPGFSKFGAYYANGNSDGPYVHCGFRPAWILIKNTSLAQPWVLMDNKINPANLAKTRLSTSNNNGDHTSGDNYIDFLADGFKVRSGSSTDINYSGSYPNHKFMAFAEHPGLTPFDAFANSR